MLVVGNVGRLENRKAAYRPWFDRCWLPLDVSQTSTRLDGMNGRSRWLAERGTD